jgi:sugar phosphate permease
VLGGAGGSFLYRRDKRYPAILAGSMAILACFPFWILLNHVNASSSFATIGAVSVSAGLASGVTGPIIKATLQNVTLPQSRGQAFALFNTFDDFGRGLGPVFVSVLISSVGGRTPAFNIGVIGWMVCGVFNLIIYFTVECDERNVQTTLASSLSKNQADTSDQSSSSSDAVVDRDESIATAKRRTIV